jgi:hypothetical protein
MTDGTWDIKKKLFPNAGTAWTKEEIYRLKELYIQKKPITEIAKELGRQESAIFSRLNQMGYKVTEQGQQRWYAKFSKAELVSWYEKQKELIQDMDCVLCDNQAEVMHHSGWQYQYKTFKEYYDESCLTPLCKECHRKLHGWETANPLEFRYRIHRIIDLIETHHTQQDFDKMELIQKILDIAHGEKKYCSVCNQAISFGVAEFSQKAYGEILCYKHQRKRDNPK